MNLQERVMRLALAQPHLRASLFPAIRRASGQLPRRWVQAVSKSLSVWDQMNPLVEGITVSDAMRMGAAQWAWDLLEGQRGTHNQAKWLYITDSPRPLMKFLERALTTNFDQHQD